MLSKRPLSNITALRARHFKFYATVPADVDLYADGPMQDTTLPCAEIHVLGAGNLSLRTVAGATVTIVGIPAGWVLPVEASRLLTAGTTATNILVLW